MDKNYQMDGDMDRLATSKNDDGNQLFAFCTTDSVKVGLSGSRTEAGGWFDREQVIEFIAILSRIVYSKPAEKKEPAPVPEVVEAR